ncbi:hypothetical protein LSUE1_G004892 [Lachnellula suecica]|uniref:Tc1-like transposase DDE domain-containing protein n=1 Tax=Lachnellula suecica TaxID=602035 RepID=A0A8T9CJA4_9HELO|nr:hypothetical protein LSUE1_G004892 [Lachnellula suecica]
MEHQNSPSSFAKPFKKAHELCCKDNSSQLASSLLGYPQIPLDDTTEFWNFIQKDVCAPTLEALAPRLWWMSKQSSTHIWPLHYQAIKLRNIVVSENPELHLVWYYDRIFIKPLPKYLLSLDFWDIYLKSQYPLLGPEHEIIKRSALGLLRSYRYLVQYESDFYIAQEKHLIPSTATWESFSLFLLDLRWINDEDVTAVFLDEFEVIVATPTVSRALASAGWSRKAARRVAKERNADLRDFYLHNLSEFCSYLLVYIDESGFDNRIGFRRTGWSPMGATLVQIARLHRDQRHQILPAYTQNGILLARVFQRSTDTAIFEDFIEQLLHHCSRWPEPKSILIIDNASFHSTRIEQLYRETGVKLVYLPPYSPDLNPIEDKLTSRYQVKRLLSAKFGLGTKNTVQHFLRK